MSIAECSLFMDQMADRGTESLGISWSLAVLCRQHLCGTPVFGPLPTDGHSERGAFGRTPTKRSAPAVAVFLRGAFMFKLNSFTLEYEDDTPRFEANVHVGTVCLKGGYPLHCGPAPW